MSDPTVPKPAVEEPLAALATEAPPAEPATEVKAVDETPAAAAAAEPAATEEAAPVKEEVKPVEDGVLGYKGPGLLKGLIFQKKYFWFGSEPVEKKSLSSYLRGEKDDANHNAAWASHTGSGLLFFTKKASEKSTPAGIINLSEASEPAFDGPVSFFFTVDGHKHIFETTTKDDRDNWISVLKTKIAEAKELAPTVKEHETYKKTLDSFKPKVAAVATPKKSTEVKKEEKTEAKEDKKEEKAEAKEEKKEEKKEIKERKSRSASRKRTSIFGSIGFGKKEEKAEAKEDTPVAAAPAAEPATEPAVAEPAPAVEAPVVAEPVVPATEETAAPVEKPAETKPAPTKRNSIFGTLKSSFSSHTPKKAEEAPAVPAKDAEPVSETAPVIPAVESTEPLATSVGTPATAPVETTTATAPVTNGETKTETPVTKSDKRKSSLPWLSKKEKPTSEDETEKPKSPFAKLRATVKGKSSPKAEKAPEKETEKPAEKPAEEAPVAETKPEEPVVSEPTPVVNSTTPQVSATA